MKKVIASLALTAALGAGLNSGAQAQTFPTQTVQGNAGIYSLSVIPTVTNPAPMDYLYSYQTTLTSNPSGTSVNVFNINNIKGFIGGSGVALDTITATNPGPGFSAAAPLETIAGDTTTLQFTSATGFKTVGDQSTFEFESTLPPAGTVSLGSNGKNPTVAPADGNLAGTGGAVGPGAASVVPEAGSFALLGLGLLPLGLVARRRLARNN